MGAPTLQGAPTYDFANFFQKLYEIEIIWMGGGGAHPKFYYVDPPLANAKFTLGPAYNEFGYNERTYLHQNQRKKIIKNCSIKVYLH